MFEIATEAFEHARSSVAELIGAKSPQEFLGSLEIRKNANLLQKYHLNIFHNDMIA